MSIVAMTPDCTPKCRSAQHADEVVAAMTVGGGSDGGVEGRLCAFLTAHCHNAATLSDGFGRTALHLAASLGRRGLLEWLLESKSADLLAKDKESGWTAMHRSAFYGHIHCLMALVKHGGSLTLQDKEGLSTLDLTMKDRPAHVVFRNTDPTEVYTWGNNANFTLGHGNHESRHHPEILDLFARTGVYVKQVVLCKFHSVFLSQTGKVFTCGHGQGGRLGHGDEQTYLVPRMVEGLLGVYVCQVAAARDHTAVLSEDGSVYSFGLNRFHQLGLNPPPTSSLVPKHVSCKALKGRHVIGIAAGRFHTAMWTHDAVYTVGLNGGQLGYLLDPNGEKCVTAPRQVSALHHKEISISMVAASNGATVCVTVKGDVYLLADYQCKKLASRQLNIRKILVTGGSLDHRVDPQVLNENVGEKVAILALDEAGRVFCWRSVGGALRQCRWAYGRQVFMSDIALNKSNMMFVTQEGEAFSGQWLGEYKKISDKKDPACVEVCGHSEAGGGVYERIRLEKLPYVHRAVSITTDSKGRNFGVLQSDPKTSLYEVPSVSSSTFSEHLRRLRSEADETDSIHDVTLQAGDRTFPAHKYVLSTRSDFFRKLLYREEGQGDNGEGGNGVDWDEEEEVCRSEDASGCDLLILEKVPPELLEQALQFIYADSCEMLTHGSRPSVPRPGALLKAKMDAKQQQQEQLIHSLQELGLGDSLRGRSALEVYRSLPPPVHTEGDYNNKDANKEKANSTNKGKGNKAGKKGGGKGNRGGDGGGGGGGSTGTNPVKMLQALAKRLGLGSLSSRLEGVKFENGTVTVATKKTGSRPKFNQRKGTYLCDVTLRAEDGKEFPCHKCVLCARLEYFNRMLGNPWIEATSCTALDMPTSSEVLQVILEYVYTDDSPTVKESQKVEFVCNVLVVADQLLISRLKEMCEVAVTENLTLKNAAELLEFASMYNADQLKLSCQQFIVLNMAALLESRALDVLSEDVLVELSAAYRRMIPAMQKRLITPYPNAPDLSAYEDKDLLSCLDTSNQTNHTSTNELLLKKAKLKAKRKPRRRLDSSGGYNLSDVIQSPPPSGDKCLSSGVFFGEVVRDGGPPAKANSVESLHEVITSDSEGSYMGVGSPRDLQSPIPLHRQDTQEERSAPPWMRTPPSTPNLRNESSALAVSSAPEPIPVVKASPSPSAVPQTPPVVDLRIIMEMEANSMSQGGAPPKSPGSWGSVSKASPLPTKLSQKQRKMMMAMAGAQGPGQEKAAAAANTRTPSAPPIVTPTKPAKAWATAVQSPPALRSFRDVLEEEEKRVRSPPSASASASPASSFLALGAAGSPVGAAAAVAAAASSSSAASAAAAAVVTTGARRVTFKRSDSNDAEKPAGPWVLGGVGSPPGGAAVTFATILEEERRQEAALIRSREKPLALIQIEERAIQDLLLHYRAANNPEEMIVVERTAQGPIATPTWNKNTGAR
ncbi:inhibitor of Bruton tyrosine kinase isoform X2 [Engraulis encrasicolus]|uniref:inhibitor of Bruton tyrosine kinase isoform X2 n=1 Tax=Engraulis encrasicolus TaxID=184585 RepID=UPI002FD05D12